MTRAEDYWGYFAGEARRAGSPLYALLAERIGADESLKALSARARPGQPRANMLLGAVHYLLLRGQSHPLAQYYASLGGSMAASEGDPFAHFADFVRRHEGEIASLIATRTTNTNEVGRSALLHPGFRALHAKAPAPLALIEIGPSAGLNMLWDRYAVHYRRDGEVVLRLGDDKALIIDCELRGERLPLAGATPKVAARLGLELNPTDLADPHNRDWLCALVWPEHVERLRRLRAAMTLQGQMHLDIRSGDARDNLMAAIAAAPAATTVCIYHTIALYQFSRAMKQDLEDLLTVAGLRRPLFRLGFELAADMRHLLSLRRYHDGLCEEWILAEAQPHGSWMQWLA